MHMVFASFLFYVLLLLQFSLGSNSQKFFTDASKEFSVDKLGTNPQGFFVKTDANPDELLFKKSKTNPQGFFVKTEASPDELLIKKSKTNPQGFFVKTESSPDENLIGKSKTNPQELFIKTKGSQVNPNEISMDKSKTNPQELFIKTKFNPNFVEESDINPQGMFFIGFHSKPHYQGLNLAFNHVFFKASDLFLGKKLQIYFFTDENSTPSKYSHQLSQDEADSIPFSSSRLSDILESFSIPNHSPQAEAMEATLKECEAKPKEGEFKFCATSFESMLERTRSFLGTTRPRVLTTRILSSNHALLQNYTITNKPLEIRSRKMVVCHTVAYPYRVYYCHNGHDGRSNKLFKMALVGDNGERVEAMVVCHMDTSKWDPNHVSFKVIGGQPGTTPVCHILPTDNVAWIPSP